MAFALPRDDGVTGGERILGATGLVLGVEVPALDAEGGALDVEGGGLGVACPALVDSPAPRVEGVALGVEDAALGVDGVALGVEGIGFMPGLCKSLEIYFIRSISHLRWRRIFPLVGLLNPPSTGNKSKYEEH